ncbi:MAG: hypothetical protein HC902_03995 [Calothrix sp. SM1_5_4]|nr:hypothetical protein [Calothrix sp. SM1_5_4]
MRLGTHLIAVACAAFAVGCSTGKKTADKTAAQNVVAPAQAPATATASTTATQPPDAKSKPAKSEEKPVMTCARGSETRTIRIEDVQPKGCKLWYSTRSETEPTATSSIGPDHCNQVRDRIRQNLESAGFACADQQTTAKPAVTAASPPTPGEPKDKTTEKKAN